MIFFFTALFSAVAVRIMQMMFVTDSNTGFFKDGYESMGSFMSAGMVVLVAVTGILGFFNDHRPKDAPPNSFLFATSMLLIGIANLIEPYFGTKPPSSIPLMLVALRLLLLVSTGLSFCYLAITMFMNKKANFGLLVVPVVLWIVRLMVTFMSYTGMSNISDNLYDVAMIMATLLFLLMQAKLLCGVKKGKYSYGVLALGLMSVMLIAICILPRIVMFFLFGSQFIHSTVDSITTHFFMGFYIVVYLLITPYSKRGKKAT